MPDGINAMYLNLNNEWKPLPKKTDPRGYRQVGILTNSNTLFHRTMYETFNDTLLSPDIVINHKDHDKTNNNINNLEAVTQWLNADDRKDREYIDKLPDDAIDLKRNYVHKFYYLPSTG